MKTDPDITAYIHQLPPGHQKILLRLRDLVYTVVPEAGEAIKWGAPVFTYRNSPVCYIKGLKQHVSFGFFNGTMLNDPGNKLLGTGKYMKFIRIEKPGDLEEEQIRKWILEGFYT